MKQKILSRPKQSLSMKAFSQFRSAMLKKMPKENNRSVYRSTARLAGEEWRKLSKDEKLKWTEASPEANVNVT